MWGNVQVFFSDFAAETSIHGLKYLHKDKSFVARAYWSCAVLSALCGSGCLSWLLWVRYMELPTRTVVKNSQAPVTIMPLPAVTVCSGTTDVFELRNAFLDDIVIPRAFPRDSVDDAIQQTELTAALYTQRRELNTTLLSMLQQILDINRMGVREFISRLVPKCEQLLKRCWLRGRDVPCGEIFRRAHGRCCTFNVPEPGKEFEPEYSSSAGISGGLSLVVSEEQGPARFTVHQYLHHPEVSEATYGGMRPGRQLFVGLVPFEMDALDEIRVLDEKVRDCVFGDERALRFFPEYNFRNCPVEMRMNASLALCGCIAYTYPAPDHLVCNLTQLPCLKKNSYLNSYYGIRSSPEALRKVQRALAEHGLVMDFSCPSNCDYHDYRVTDLQSSILGTLDTDYTGFYDNVDAKADIVVHVFFPSPYYLLQEILMVADFTTLLSSLGGVFGLFLGCSFVTVAELLYFLWSRVGSGAVVGMCHHLGSKLPCARPNRMNDFKKVHLTIVGPTLVGSSKGFFICEEVLAALEGTGDLYMKK